MDNLALDTAINDLLEAIKGITLGSVESVVLQAAGEELINNWNDHMPDEQIEVARELRNFKLILKDQQ